MNDFLLDDEEEQTSEDLFGIADYYSPSSYSSLPLGASRDDLVNSLQGEIASGTDMMKEGKRLSLYEDDDLPGTKGSLAAASIFGLLPIALGAAFAGKKGALWGSNAGVAGAKPLLNRVAEQQAKAQETGLGIFKEGAARRANAEKSIAALKKDEFKEEAANARSDQSFNRQKELIDYRAARSPSGGGSEGTLTERNLQRILDLQEKPDKTPREINELNLLQNGLDGVAAGKSPLVERSPEEFEAMKENMISSYKGRYGKKVLDSDLALMRGAKTPEELATLSKDLFLNIGEDRRGDGTSPKSISDTSLGIIESAAKSGPLLKPVLSKLDKYTAQLEKKTPGGKFLINQLEKLIPTSEASILQQELDQIGYDIVVAAQGRSASDTDVRSVQRFFGGSEAMSVNELSARLKRIHAGNARAARARLDSLKTDPARAEQALQLEEAYGMALPSLDSMNTAANEISGNANIKMPNRADFGDDKAGYLAALNKFLGK